jgi:hypothetical protein
MAPYYYIDSNGEHTNLQLYSLKQAKKYWESIEADVATGGPVQDLHERCVFVINVVGPSVSQLLGQNNPEPNDRVPSPAMIFNALVDKHGLAECVKDQFRDFIDAYDGCRHFGITSDQRRYAEVSQLTYQRADELFRFALKVWEMVIAIYRKDRSNELEDLDLANIGREP